jgi:preprotein translocase subunit SecA
VPADATGAALGADDAEPSAFGTTDGRAAGAGVRVSGVDLDAPAQRSGALHYSAPGEDGRAVESGGQQTVERQADRRGKKVKRKRR